MLTIQYVPHSEIANLESEKKVDKLLSYVIKEKLIVLQGALKSKEEAMLIEKTMEKINQKKFKGIEIATINPAKNENVILKMKKFIVDVFVGEINSLTFIGPASIIKEIKRDPENLQVFVEGFGKNKKGK